MACVPGYANEPVSAMNTSLQRPCVWVLYYLGAQFSPAVHGQAGEFVQTALRSQSSVSCCAFL